MDKKQFFDRAKEIFALHSKEDKIFFTSDGQGFFQQHFADAHSQTLKEKEIALVTREDLERVTPVADDLTDEQKAEAKRIADEQKAEAKRIADEQKAEALRIAMETPEADRTPQQKGLITKANKVNQQ